MSDSLCSEQKELCHKCPVHVLKDFFDPVEYGGIKQAIKDMAEAQIGTKTSVDKLETDFDKLIEQVSEFRGGVRVLTWILGIAIPLVAALVAWIVSKIYLYEMFKVTSSTSKTDFIETINALLNVIMI